MLARFSGQDRRSFVVDALKSSRLSAKTILSQSYYTTALTY